MKKLKMLPSMKCDTGCGECCGAVPATEKEYRKVLFVARANGITPKRQGITCPFYQEGTCQVYEARPLACRLFGHVKAMACPRGYNTNIRDDESHKMVMQNGFPTRLLHEALIEAGLVKTIEEAVGEVPEGAVP